MNVYLGSLVLKCISELSSTKQIFAMIIYFAKAQPRVFYL